MSIVSTAPAALTNLITLISAQPQCVSVDNFPFGIRRGEPFHGETVADIIYITQVNRTILRAEMRGGSPGGYREDYVIPIQIQSFRGGDNVTDAEARLWSLLSAVETAVSTDRTLGGAVPESWPEASPVVIEWDADSEGRVVSTTLNVHCWSFI